MSSDEDDDDGARVWFVLATSKHDDPQNIDLGLSLSPAGGPTHWHTVSRASWPGKWPPLPADRVELILPTVVAVLRPKRAKASANKSASLLAGSPD